MAPDPDAPGAFGNAVVGYGLTLVAGLPLPPNVTACLAPACQQLEAARPGQFSWYGAGHLHVTIRALLRTRHRAGPPLQRQELPADLAGLAADLGDLAAAEPPLQLRFGAPTIAPDGRVEAEVWTSVSPDWWTRLSRYHGLHVEPPRRFFHVSLGYERAAGAPASVAAAQELLGCGACIVDHLWLVHYANRTLDRLVGRLRLNLGEPNPLTAEQIIEALGLAG